MLEDQTASTAKAADAAARKECGQAIPDGAPAHFTNQRRDNSYSTDRRTNGGRDENALHHSMLDGLADLNRNPDHRTQRTLARPRSTYGVIAFACLLNKKSRSRR
jgi:hypothetical protein